MSTFLLGKNGDIQKRERSCITYPRKSYEDYLESYDGFEGCLEKKRCYQEMGCQKMTGVESSDPNQDPYRIIQERKQ